MERGRLSTRVAVSGALDSGARVQPHGCAVGGGCAATAAELDTLRHDLIAWVGHDLRTPLASVRAIIEALADGLVTDMPTTNHYLRTAKRDIGALSLLIDDLFEMAQINSGWAEAQRAVGLDR